MMRCEMCSHEFTAFDFISLRNLCEHVYLDSLAQKQGSRSSKSDCRFSQWDPALNQFDSLN